MTHNPEGDIRNRACAARDFINGGREEAAKTGGDPTADVKGNSNPRIDYESLVSITAVSDCRAWSFQPYNSVLIANNSGKKLVSRAFFRKGTPEEPPVP